MCATAQRNAIILKVCIAKPLRGAPEPESESRESRLVEKLHLDTSDFDQIVVAQRLRLGA